MPPSDRKRCFECGASYPPDAHRCEEDSLPLWPDTISGVWRVEGVLGLRLGGATCAAYHLVTGARVAVDLVRGSPSPDPAAIKTLTQEIQALRLLEHPNTLRLVEEGIDRSHNDFDNGDGIHFLVTDLGSARPLPDLLEDWHRPGGPAERSTGIPLGAMSQVGRQILGLLSAAHRLGLAHGGLSIDHIYVTSDEDSLGNLQRAGSIRLHGLRAIGLGPALREAIDADLAGVIAVLYELVSGNPPSSAEEAKAAPPKLPSDVDGKLAQFILRGLGVGRAVRFGSADEMLRALVVASPPTPTEVSPEALANLTRTDPQAARPASSPDIRSVPSDHGVGPAALPRISGSHGVLPAPPSGRGAPVGNEPALRSRFSGELKQVSFRDLVDQKEAKPGREETLARARRRVSSSSMKISALPAPPEGESDHVNHTPRRQAYTPQAISSGEHASLEPTADLQALPVDFASAVSAPALAPVREGRSEISLPPQPSLPPEAQLPSRPASWKPPEPTKSNPPRATPEPPPPAPVKPAPAPVPVKPPIPDPAAVVSDDSIDPLGITGQGPIPMEVLIKAKRLHDERAAEAAGKLAPPVAAPPRPQNGARSELPPPPPPPPIVQPPALAVPTKVEPDDLKPRAGWPYFVVLIVLVVGALSLLLLR